MGEEKKPFDVNDLQQRLQAKGIPAFEGMAKVCFEEICAWTEDGIRASQTQLDDIVLGLIPPFRDFVLSKIDRIS